MKKSAELAKAYRRLHDHPVAGLLVEDLAASREHGLVTARVGIAPDGNPIIYARDEAIAKRIGEAMQNQTAVHVRPIPPLDMQAFRVLSRQAEKSLGVAKGEPGIALGEYRGAVAAALTGACGIASREEAERLVERYASGVEKGHREGRDPEVVARAIANKVASP